MELFYIRSPIRSFSSQINRFSRIVSQVGEAASPVPSTGAASMRNLRIALTKEVAAPPLPQLMLLKIFQETSQARFLHFGAFWHILGKCLAHASRCLYWL